MRAVAVLDGTSRAVERHAQALSAFLGEGLLGEVVCESVVFHDERTDTRRLVELSPTRDVRLCGTAGRRPDLMVEALTTLVLDRDVSLVLFAAGPLGTELAAHLAARTGGAVLTDVLIVEEAGGRLLCRKDVYSNHLRARFELSPQGPSCITIDASWQSGKVVAAAEHRVLAESVATGAADTTPFEDVELVDAPSTDDLAESRFLVVAGRGAGSRPGIERIAEAARRLGARFGVSRPVAMNGWAPLDRTIGVSGARAAPDVCIVAGASGAPALHWGIERSALIVAVNTDDRAPIIANADVALLDDAVAVVEALADLVGGERPDD
jgi:electron transfer flavoprotein alpha subunit